MKYDTSTLQYATLKYLIEMVLQIADYVLSCTQIVKIILRKLTADCCSYVIPRIRQITVPSKK